MSDVWTRLRDRFFGIDLRSLALFRVGLAVLLLVDLAGRWPDLEAHYSDAGVLPLAVTPAYVPVPVHFLAGSAAFEGLLFVVAALVAVSLLVGYHTTLATFFSWLLLLSLHARNPLVLHGGDLLERMLLFWAMFLPLGARWSLDARRGTHLQSVRDGGRIENPSHARTLVCSVATAALILQVVFMYWFGLAARTSPSWWADGTAVAEALSLDFYATPLGVWARTLPPDVLRFATYATVTTEAAGPALLLLSGGMGRLRTAVIAVMVAFHILLGLGLRLGTFPLACVVAWLPFLPSACWDGLRRFRPSRPATEAPAPAPAAAPALSPIATAMVLVALTYVVLCNVQWLRGGFALSLVRGVGLEQSWGMFAPQPNREDGWYVVVGRQEDGNEVDPFRGGPVSWDKPERISAIYPNVRWAAYLTVLRWPGYEGHRELFADYLGRRWNAQHDGGEVVKSVEVYYMLRFIRPDYTTTTPEKVLLARVERAP